MFFMVYGLGFRVWGFGAFPTQDKPDGQGISTARSGFVLKAAAAKEDGRSYGGSESRLLGLKSLGFI